MLSHKVYGRFTGTIMTIVMLLSLVATPVTFAEGDEKERPSDSENFHLSIMHMNDTHAHVEPMTRMITAIKKYREDKPEALLLHGGDVLSGTLYFHEFKGQADVAMMNLMGIDAMVFGNHEFDLGAKEGGQESLSKFVKEANFPLLSTNIDFSGDPFMKELVHNGKAVENSEGGKAYHSIVKEVDGERIGIFGLTTEDTKDIASPEEVRFSNYIEAARNAVAAFESKGINKIISVNHIGYNSDPSVGNDLLLAKNVEGIDIIVGGHSHTPLAEPVLVTEGAAEEEPTVIVQAGEYTEYLGTLNVEFDEESVIVGHDGELLEVAGYEADGEAVGVLQTYKDDVDELANKETGAIAIKELPNPRQDDLGEGTSVRANETELGNLITDAMLAKAKEKYPETVIYMQNGGGIRAPITEGPITIGEVISVLPFGNDPVIAELTGAEIKEILEHSVRNAPGENGGFLHVSGMKFTFDGTKDVGSRVETMEVEVNGKYEPIDENKEYTITTNNFTGTGGDGFDTFSRAYKDGRVKDIGEIDWEQMSEYMTEEAYLNGEVNPEIEGRIIDIKVDPEPEDFQLSVMHMNDTHAHVEPMPRMITAIKDVRSTKPDSLLLHAGDVFSGTMYFNEFKGQADLALMNLMDIDAMVFGNHEFDLGSSDEGHQALRNFVDGANFPFLGTNIDFSKDNLMKDIVVSERMVENPEAGKSYHSIVKEVNGEKIGIFGLTTEDTKYIASPISVQFNDYIKTAEAAVKGFEAEGINKIISVNHIGYDSDPSVGNDLLLAANVDGIDVIIGGHSHTKLEEPVLVEKDAKGNDKDPTVIVQAYQYSEYLGTLDVDFDEEGVVTSHDGELLEAADYDEDVEATVTLEKYSKEVGEVMTEESGATALKDLLNPRQDEPGDDSVRANETELGNLVTDAMLAKAKLKEPDTVISLQNGGGIRLEIKKGPITIGEIISVLPFGNNPVVVTLTGAEIKEILEHSVRNTPAENEGFLHVAGMKFTYDSLKDVDDRVQTMHVNIDGELIPIVADESYMVTTNAFTGSGGDGFKVLAQADEDGRVRDIGETDWEQLLDYMVDDLDGAVDPVREGRIIDLKGEEPEGPEESETPGEPEDQEKPEVDETKENGDEEDEEPVISVNEDKLPKTATNIFTYMLIGSILLLVGGGFMLYRKFKVE